MTYLRSSYSFWEMLAGVPALHAQYDAEDALDRHLRRRDQAHLGARNDYALFLENFEGILDTRPESGIDSPDDIGVQPEATQEDPGREAGGASPDASHRG